MSPSIKLDKAENGKVIDQTKYRDMIGSLFFLAANELNIMFSVYMCARFQGCLIESQLHMFKIFE